MARRPPVTLRKDRLAGRLAIHLANAAFFVSRVSCWSIGFFSEFERLVMIVHCLDRSWSSFTMPPMMASWLAMMASWIVTMLTWMDNTFSNA